MPDFQGKFQYLAQDGSIALEGACRLRFDSQTFALTPENGAALVFDLGDLDAVTGGNYEVRLPLYTGRTIVLRQLGKSYDNVAHDLGEVFRNRSVQCMLLEDMSEISRFTGNVERGGTSCAAEIRLYKSNLAVLPASRQGFQCRLADIDEVKLDSSAFEVTLQSGGSSIKFTRLAKRTEEFASKMREAINELTTQSVQALRGMLPFLDPDHLQSCALLLREGRSAPLAKLAALHKQIPAALAANAVDKDLKPYYDHLVARGANGMAYVGFKLIRPEGIAGEAEAKGSDTEAPNDDAPDGDASPPETLYWFFFPLTRRGSAALTNVVAWEANSQSGRATYFFRLVDPAQAAQLADPALAPTVVDASVRRLNTVLAMLNFRRRPIYLSDDELAMDPRFHRYAIAARRLAEVREVRATFIGRALHSSVEAWQAQVDAIIEGSQGESAPPHT